jgi:hypothetical protein
MKAIATKQPTNESVKQNKSGEKGRSRSVSPLSTGMPLLQRQCACGGGCPRCKEELGIQTKLKIGEPGDKYEQEADRIADEVMRMPEPSMQRQIEPEEDEEIVQRKVSANPTSLNSEQSSSEISPIVHEVLNSPGQPLDPETRTFMESRFGHDFSQVIVRADSKAVASAQALGARAYTVGDHIAFNAGEYESRTAQRQYLLAHELVHVVQQNQSTLQSQQLIQRQCQTNAPSSSEGWKLFVKDDQEKIYKDEPGAIGAIRRFGESYPEQEFICYKRGDNAWEVWSRMRGRTGAETPTEKAGAQETTSSEGSPTPTKKAGEQKTTSSAGSPTPTTVVSCRNEKQKERVERIISRNHRRYPASVTMYLYAIKEGETLESIAQRIQADNTVDLAGQLAKELRQLNTHITPKMMNINDCVILLRGWVHPNIGSLPAAPDPAALPWDVKHTIATVYGEQWDTTANAQEQQRYIWYSIRKRITSSVRGPNLNSVVNSDEYHAIGGNLYNAAMGELNKPPLISPGVITAQNAVLNNWSNTLPIDAGKFYFHWLNKSTPERCYGRSIAATSEEKERECASKWATTQGWIGNVSQAEGWLKRIRGDSPSPNERIRSMYIYP